ncbi:hypothetical protein GCM10018779_01270 [Streptomyces griseocarneus]|nr:hypothetical protein GCM10018779_01270 [Streptomyces griseocarneus]
MRPRAEGLRPRTHPAFCPAPILRILTERLAARHRERGHPLATRFTTVCRCLVDAVEAPAKTLTSHQDQRQMSAIQASLPTGLRIATHSTWCVIGNKSNARSFTGL